MSDGTIRNSIEGVYIPKRFDKVYMIAHKNALKEKNQNGNKDKSSNIEKK
jgi:hypothetical protein